MPPLSRADEEEIPALPETLLEHPVYSSILGELLDITFSLYGREGDVTVAAIGRLLADFRRDHLFAGPRNDKDSRQERIESATQSFAERVRNAIPGRQQRQEFGERIAERNRNSSKPQMAEDFLRELEVLERAGPGGGSHDIGRSRGAGNRHGENRDGRDTYGGNRSRQQPSRSSPIPDPYSRGGRDDHESPGYDGDDYTDTDSTLTRNEHFENGNSDREDRGGYGVTFLGSRFGF